MKQRVHPELGSYTPVKLTRRQRLGIYRALICGVQATEFAELIPVAQLESILKEFMPGAPHIEPKDQPPRGIRGDKWYCEAGCGTVMHRKEPGQVFCTPGPRNGRRFVCKACLSSANKSKQTQEKER